MRIVLGLLAGVAAVYALACLGLYFSQRALIFYPQPRRAGASVPVMTLATGGERIKVSLREQAGAEAIIYFGGNAEDVSASVDGLALAFPGQALYLMHYRGYGGSSGKPSQAALFADAEALYDKVSAAHPKVTLIGRSLGSGVALHLANARPATRLVLVTPYDSIVELAASQFPYFPVAWMLTDKFESWRDAQRVRLPTTIVAADDDRVIPPASTRRLQSRFQAGVARYIELPGTGHNTISDHPAYPGTLQGRP